MTRPRKLKDAGQLDLWASVPARAGQDEMNMTEWPFALLSDTQPKDTRSVSFTDTIRVANGATLRRSWTLEPTATGSLPTPADESVYVALMELTRETGSDSPRVTFTMYELCKRLGWGTGGKDYKRLEEALDRLKGVTIKAKNAFFDADGRAYKSVTFNILNIFGVGDKGTLSFVEWSEVLYKSIQARYTKDIDVAFFMSLETPLARRLYRYLDRKRHGNTSFSIDLKKMAFERLGMSRSYSAPEIRRNLKRPHEELQAREFITGVEFGKAADGAPKVTYFFPRAEIAARGERRNSTTAKETVLASVDPSAELDALITPEILTAAAEVVQSRKVGRPRMGRKAWDDMVRTEARRIAGGK